MDRNADTIADDEPVTLAEACRLFFGGRLSPSALRTEAAKGNLEIIQIARKDFVTKRAIEDMKRACTKRVSTPLPAKTARPDTSVALAAALATVNALKMRSLKRPAEMTGQEALRTRLGKSGIPSSHHRAPEIGDK